MKQYIERLGSIRLFADCDEEELEHLAQVLDEVTVPAGRALTDQGTPGREACIIVSGTADVVRDGDVVSTLGPGDYFGELSLLDAGPRNASVIATSEMDLLVMNRRQFNTVLDSVPGLARRLLTSTARRLREATGDDLH